MQLREQSAAGRVSQRYMRGSLKKTFVNVGP